MRRTISLLLLVIISLGFVALGTGCERQTSATPTVLSISAMSTKGVSSPTISPQPIRRTPRPDLLQMIDPTQVPQATFDPSIYATETLPAVALTQTAQPTATRTLRPSATTCATEEKSLVGEYCQLNSSLKAEFEVYSDIIESGYFGNQGVLVINEQTGSDRYIDRWVLDEFSLATDDLFDDFEMKNEQLSILDDCLDVIANVTYLSMEESEEIFSSEEPWDEFYRRFPDAVGLNTISRVGFNMEQDRAMVFVSKGTGPASGSGDLLILEKECGQWVIKEDLNLFIA